MKSKANTSRYVPIHSDTFRGHDCILRRQLWNWSSLIFSYLLFSFMQPGSEPPPPKTADISPWNATITNNSRFCQPKTTAENRNRSNTNAQKRHNRASPAPLDNLTKHTHHTNACVQIYLFEYSIVEKTKEHKSNFSYWRFKKWKLYTQIAIEVSRQWWKTSRNSYRNKYKLAKN